MWLSQRELCQNCYYGLDHISSKHMNHLMGIALCMVTEKSIIYAAKWHENNTFGSDTFNFQKPIRMYNISKWAFLLLYVQLNNCSHSSYISKRWTKGNKLKCVLVFISFLQFIHKYICLLDLVCIGLKS